ncbi:MAG: hypothetical protein HY717_15160 [Planctomycetes bacterium]|nr:hypothetical protein [Planctomycetota bacterium]
MEDIKAVLRAKIKRLANEHVESANRQKDATLADFARRGMARSGGLIAEFARIDREYANKMVDAMVAAHVEILGPDLSITDAKDSIYREVRRMWEGTVHRLGGRVGWGR